MVKRHTYIYDICGTLSKNKTKIPHTQLHLMTLVMVNVHKITDIQYTLLFFITAPAYFFFFNANIQFQWNLTSIPIYMSHLKPIVPFSIETPIIFWTFQVDLRHNDELNGTNVVEVGVDLTEFYQSVEWDILEVPAVR